MEVLEIIGLLLAFGIILLIDKPKLDATAKKKKYTAVYYSIIVIGLTVGMLEVFNLIPEFNGMLVDLYKKLMGNQ